MENEEEVLQRYGTPLEPLKEDDIPAKKPILIEDQIVTDENGKRRFHGAFTGGFSAGFWNTVGSLEGWKPAEFKSSRGEKAPQRAQQRPEDFMDDEDLGEFGIAPQRIQAQSDFQIEGANSHRQRKTFAGSGASGTIPGTPLLAELLRPVEDKIAVRILKSMGWKPGQGIGPRLTGKQKRRTRERNKREEYVLKRYGCLEEDEDEEPDDEEKTDKHKAISIDASKADDYDDDDNDDDDDGITFAPDDYETLVCTFKMNRFGLGYSGLSSETSSGEKPTHFNLFGPLDVVDKNNKRLAIRGQAFGVGALEEEDEDIYAGEDLTKYDFTLEEKKPQRKLQKPKQDRHIIDGFGAAQREVQYQAPFLVEPPAGFQPRNWSMRKSRFAPLPAERAREIEAESNYKKAGLGRHDLNPAQRSAILEEKPPESKKYSLEEQLAAQKARDERTKSLLERISATSDNFTRGGLINTKGEEVRATATEDEMSAMKQAVEEEKNVLLAKASSKTAGLGPSPLDNSKFKPFLNNEAKQLRYEKFLDANLKNETEIAAFLATIQPVELSEFDREIERKEFMQAKKIYKPLAGFMSQRFVSEAALAEEKNKKTSEEVSKDEKTPPTEGEKKIVMKRTKDMWKPHPLLCKRYNIAEPFGGHLDDSREKRTKLSIYDYLETSVNRKDDFQTPVIIPKRTEKPKAVVDNRYKSGRTEKRNQTQDSLPDAVKSPTTELQQPQAEPPSSSSKAVRPFKLPPKSDLEKRVEESRDKPPSEKVELFRAIFEDSDEEVEQKPQQQQQDPAPAAKLEIEKLALPTTINKPNNPPSVAEVNLPKSNSPPRGMFATLFKSDAANIKKPEPEKANKEPANNTQVPAKITFKPRRERQKEIEVEDTYGPSLPPRLKIPEVQLEGPKLKKATESQLGSSPSKRHKSDKVMEDVWVERQPVVVISGNSASSDDSYSSDDSAHVPIKRPKKRKKKSKKSKKHNSKNKVCRTVGRPRKRSKSKKKSKKRSSSSH